jgi:DNA-binding XRE family transcriptional regulator
MMAIRGCKGTVLAKRPPRDDPTDPPSGNSPESDLPDSVRAFAENLLSGRKAAKLTQVQLSQRSGVSQSHISQLEKGNLEPRLSTILALSWALEIEVSSLIEGDLVFYRWALMTISDRI